MRRLHSRRGWRLSWVAGLAVATATIGCTRTRRASFEHLPPFGDPVPVSAKPADGRAGLLSSEPRSPSNSNTHERFPSTGGAVAPNATARAPGTPTDSLSALRLGMVSTKRPMSKGGIRPVAAVRSGAPDVSQVSAAAVARRKPATPPPPAALPARAADQSSTDAELADVAAAIETLRQQPDPAAAPDPSQETTERSGEESSDQVSTPVVEPPAQESTATNGAAHPQLSQALQLFSPGAPSKVQRPAAASGVARVAKPASRPTPPESSASDRADASEDETAEPNEDLFDGDDDSPLAMASDAEDRLAGASRQQRRGSSGPTAGAAKDARGGASPSLWQRFKATLD